MWAARRAAGPWSASSPPPTAPTPNTGPPGTPSARHSRAPDEQSRRGLQHGAAAIPVRLHPGAPLAVQPDLQHVRNSPPGSAEPDLQLRAGYRLETRDAWRLLGRRVHVRRGSPAAHARMGGPHPQPPAALADEADRLRAYLQPHDPAIALTWVYRLRPMPPNVSTWSFGSAGVTSGRHIWIGTTPGSIRSRPAKKLAICSGVRKW